jgi:dihydroorotate dehydrogenase
MSFYTYLIRPLLFRCDPEWTHDGAIRVGRLVGALPPLRWLLTAAYAYHDPRLRVELCGIGFRNPLGLAAGFDKNGHTAEAMAAIGCGHVEIGSISADPSSGNPRPRLFRLPQDRAIVVHYGLPNEGAEAIAARLGKKRSRVPLGINLVKTNRGIDAPPDGDEAIIDDYVRSMRVLKDAGDYFCLNLSCPNTETGRNFFAETGNIRRLMDALGDLEIDRPVFLKVSPLGGVEGMEGMLEEVEGVDIVSGFVFNLPPNKPDGLRTPRQLVDSLPGAVSGKPVEGIMDDCIGELYRRMDRDRYRIIGIGGVFSAEDAYRKIRLGASLVQVLTALVFEGPGVVGRINRGLVRLLERDGFESVGEAVGVDNQ